MIYLRSISKRLDYFTVISGVLAEFGEGYQEEVGKALAELRVNEV